MYYKLPEIKYSGERFDETWWRKWFCMTMEGAGNDHQARWLTPCSFIYTLNTLPHDANQYTTKIGIILGWKQKKVYEHYAHWQIDHLKEQAWIAEELMGY